ncbi:hypothetical protein [Bordetella sp. 2513F-2]
MSASPHSHAPAGLRAWLRGAEAAAVDTVAEVVVDGVPCVVKRRRPGVGRGLSYVLRYLRAAALAAGCRLFLGEFPRPGVLLRNGLDHEAGRLRHLLAAGCRVPEVWWQEPGLLVLEHVGESMPVRMRRADPQGLRELVQAVASDLAGFHRRGFWHGGAQIRNLTLRDGQVWRIDFEENIGSALSLPLAQAYDLYQALSSLHAMRGMPEPMLPELGTLLIDTYFATQPEPAVRERARRIARLVCGAARVLRPVAGRWSGRDIRAFFRVADTLQGLLQS